MNPVAQTMRSAGSSVPSSSSAAGFSAVGQQPGDGPVRVHDDAAGRDALVEPLGGEPDRAAHDVLHLPGRHEAEPLEPELADRRRPDRVDHVAAHAVGRAVQELLDAARTQVLEQGLAHPGQQQHLEVEEAADTARHLPQQVPGDHVGARRHLAHRDRDVTGRFAVPDDQHPLAPGLLLVVQVGAGEHLAAGRGELGLARVARHCGLAEHPVGHHERVELLGRPGSGDVPPARCRGGRCHLGAQAQRRVEPEMACVRREVGLDLRAGRPFGIVARHGEVRQGVLRLRALRGQSRVPAGAAPHATDVGCLVVDDDLVPGLAEHFRGGQPGNAGADDPDAHGQRTSGGSCSLMPKSAMICLIFPMSLGPGGMSASAW